MTKEINDKLGYIQSKLKAPKGQTNKYMKYRYRSCEDILEAVKPLLEESGTTLTLNDELVNIGDRFYIKAIATLFYKLECIVVNGWAREIKEKQGMDLCQITGACSSYARKYALNGLFLIDDTEDSDATNKGETSKQKLKKVSDEWNKETAEDIQKKKELEADKKYIEVSEAITHFKGSVEEFGKMWGLNTQKLNFIRKYAYEKFTALEKMKDNKKEKL